MVIASSNLKKNFNELDTYFRVILVFHFHLAIKMTKIETMKKMKLMKKKKAKTKNYMSLVKVIKSR